MCRMCAGRTRTHAEWNVAISGAWIPIGASNASTRRAISPAALLVNVTARTFFGCTPRTPRSHAIRWAMTRVFPLPAPASTRRGPSPAVTASRCGGFRSARRASRSSTRRLYRMPDGASWAVMRRPRRPAPIDRPPGARGGRGLFDRDALRQVAWLVDVAAEAHGDVVGEKLERDDGDERRQELGARRHLDDVLRLRRDAAAARVGHGDHEAVAGPPLLDVAEHALVRGVADHQRYHGELVGDERDRAVLHLTAGIALGMDVGNLLELERPLEGDGVLDATAQIEDVARVGELAGERRDLGVQPERRLDQPRDLDEVVDAFLHVLGRDGVARAAEPQAEQVHGHDHRRERLRGRDADLGPRVHVEDAGRLARERGAHDVGDREDRAALEAGGPW